MTGRSHLLELFKLPRGKDSLNPGLNLLFQDLELLLLLGGEIQDLRRTGWEEMVTTMAGTTRQPGRLGFLSRGCRGALILSSQER
jgi:hypothetical protein